MILFSSEIFVVLFFVVAPSIGDFIDRDSLLKC